MACAVEVNCINKRWCYCSMCQKHRVLLYTEKLPDVLWNELAVSKHREIVAIETAFTEVLNQICISKAFRLQIYHVFRYKNTACYFKSIKGDTKEEAAKKAKIINTECKIYDNFNLILSNLSCCKSIDIKRLSVNQLYLSIDSNWCQMYNEMQSDRENKQAVANLVYEEEDFKDFLQMVKNHPVYHSIDTSRENNYGKREVSALLLRTQKSLLWQN